MPTKDTPDCIKYDAIDCMRPRDIEAKLRQFDALLKKCHAHLGQEIQSKHLNESAHDGTQALSAEVAKALDSIWSNTKT